MDKPLQIEGFPIKAVLEVLEFRMTVKSGDSGRITSKEIKEVFQDIKEDSVFF